jgi:phosphoribosylformylglycinamidine synthase
VRSGKLSSAHDVAEGGLAVALAECAIAGGLGAEVELEDGSEAAIFGETAGGFAVSGPAAVVREIAARAPHQIIGSVGGRRLKISAGETQIDVSLERLREAHAALAERFE